MSLSPEKIKEMQDFIAARRGHALRAAGRPEPPEHLTARALAVGAVRYGVPAVTAVSGIGLPLEAGVLLGISRDQRGDPIGQRGIKHAQTIAYAHDRSIADG